MMKLKKYTLTAKSTRGHWAKTALWSIYNDPCISSHLGRLNNPVVKCNCNSKTVKNNYIKHICMLSTWHHFTTGPSHDKRHAQILTIRHFDIAAVSRIVLVAKVCNRENIDWKRKCVVYILTQWPSLITHNDLQVHDRASLCDAIFVSNAAEMMHVFQYCNHNFPVI